MRRSIKSTGAKEGTRSESPIKRGGGVATYQQVTNHDFCCEPTQGKSGGGGGSHKGGGALPPVCTYAYHRLFIGVFGERGAELWRAGGLEFKGGAYE